MLMPLLESPTLDSQDFNCNYSSDMSKWRYILKPLTQRFVPLGAIGYAGLPDSTGSAPAYSSAPLPLPVQRTLAPGSQRPAPTDSFTGLQRSVNSFSHNFDVPPNHDVNQGLFPIPNSNFTNSLAGGMFPNFMSHAPDTWSIPGIESAQRHFPSPSS